MHKLIAIFLPVFSFVMSTDVSAAAFVAKIKFKDCPQSVELAANVSISQGLSCLGDLGTPTALDHISKLTEKLSDSYRISCVDKNLGSVGAYAAVNGAWMDVPSPTWKSSALPATIFHELFHSIGYTHMAGVEYAYSCEACCFETKNDAIKRAGCQVCSSHYDKPNDNIQYLTDIQNFASAVSESGNAENFKSPSSAFSPLPLWVLQLSRSSFNKEALRGVVLSLATNRFEISFLVAKNLYTIASEQVGIEDSNVAAIFGRKIDSRFYFLKLAGDDLQEPNAQQKDALVAQFVTAFYSCYLGDTDAVSAALSYLKQQKKYIVDGALETDQLFKALYICSSPSARASRAFFNFFGNSQY